MLKRFFAILLTLAVAAGAGAQSIRMTPYRAATALYADVDRLFNYNLYEHARFEAGLTWVLPNEAAAHPRTFLGQWTLGAYAAYGTEDRAVKYGAAVQLRLPDTRKAAATAHDVRLRLAFKDDLEQAASRRMDSYRMTATEFNSSYVASRFSHVRAMEGKAVWKPVPRWETAVGLRYSREADLSMPGDSPMPWAQYAEASLRADFADKNHKPTHRLAVLLQPGMRLSDDSQADATCFLRALAQYSYGKVDEGLHLWAQAGYASDNAPFSRLFDLSGTGGTPYFFEHTLLTVPPDRFIADCFAHLCVKYTAPLPLWAASFSHPKPFMQMNALWGTGDGEECLAPYAGLVEPAAGFDGLIQWGLLDMGAAIAYRITPAKTDYHMDEFKENFAFSIVARLAI